MLLNTLHILKNDNNITIINKSVTDYNDTNIWCNGTILIATDSMFNNIDETRLSKSKNIKVNNFGGAKIKDMYGYLTPLLRKKPSVLILHVRLPFCG